MRLPLCRHEAAGPQRGGWRMIRRFNTPWCDVPVVVVDTETTGPRPGIDRVVQFAAVRFERGEVTAEFETLVDPGAPIPAEATAIHGISDATIEAAKRIGPVPTVDRIPELASAVIDGAQLAAYNADFDRAMLPQLCADRWPWLDPLVLVRYVDRYASGTGRHKLATSCERHGIELVGAHGALADARAAGKLLLKLGKEVLGVRLRRLDG